MKAIKILTHPYVLITSFLLIMISGKSNGGFYLMYLVVALFHFGQYAILGLAGMVLLIVSYVMFKRKRLYGIEAWMNMTGLSFLFLSLFYFFHNDETRYNYATFEQMVPLLSLCLFGLLSIGFIISNFLHRSRERSMIAF